MKKKLTMIFIVLILIAIISVIFVLYNSKKKIDFSNYSDAVRFQKEYMYYNGKLDDHLKFARQLNINADNPIRYSSFEEILQKAENGETYWVYFGFAKCPWCRSVITPMLEAAEDSGVKEILYVDIYDTRDTYKLEDGKAVLLTEGEKGYKDLLSTFGKVLNDYVLTDDEGNQIKVGEKRIYAPNVIYVENGVAKKIYGYSELETDPYAELTEEIHDDIYAGYIDLFSNL